MDDIGFALNLAAVGLAVVFAVLLIISVTVALIRRADDRWQALEEKRRQPAPQEDQNIDTTTLVLISAAVATMIQGRFHIRKVRRLMPRSQAARTWSMQGRAILHGSHTVTKKR